MFTDDIVWWLETKTTFFKSTGRVSAVQCHNKVQTSHPDSSTLGQQTQICFQPHFVPILRVLLTCTDNYSHRVFGRGTRVSRSEKKPNFKETLFFQKNWSRECCASAAGPPRCSNEPPTPDIHISSFQSHFVQNLKILPASC